MGDRGNVYIIDRYGPGGSRGEITGVYLYANQNGRLLGLHVRNALRKWAETPEPKHGCDIFLARELVCLDGIHSHCSMNEHPIIVVDEAWLRIGLAVEGAETKPFKSWTFMEFIALEDAMVIRDVPDDREYWR